MIGRQTMYCMILCKYNIIHTYILIIPLYLIFATLHFHTKLYEILSPIMDIKREIFILSLEFGFVTIHDDSSEKFC